MKNNRKKRKNSLFFLFFLLIFTFLPIPYILFFLFWLLGLTLHSSYLYFLSILSFFVLPVFSVLPFLSLLPMSFLSFPLLHPHTRPSLYFCGLGVVKDADKVSRMTIHFTIGCREEGNSCVLNAKASLHPTPPLSLTSRLLNVLPFFASPSTL